MSYYELLVIFSTTLSDEEEKAQASQVEELIKHEKGTIHLIDHWGKRKLAYSIKKQRQGYYEWLYFELDPSRIAEIDRKLKMSETILRFLTFKMEKIQIQNMNREIARRNEVAQPQPVAVPQAAALPESVTPPETEAEPQAESDVTELTPDPEPQEESVTEPGQES
jgi:small subunit ribosomal protein S6